jgi:uncharacterized membrane protein
MFRADLQTFCKRVTESCRIYWRTNRGTGNKIVIIISFTKKVNIFILLRFMFFSTEISAFDNTMVLLLFFVLAHEI